MKLICQVCLLLVECRGTFLSATVQFIINHEFNVSEVCFWEWWVGQQMKGGNEFLVEG